MLKISHDTTPFHPLEIVAFACLGLVLAVMLALLFGQKVLHDDIGLAPAWVDKFTPAAQHQPAPGIPAHGTPTR